MNALPATTLTQPAAAAAKGSNINAATTAAGTGGGDSKVSGVANASLPREELGKKDRRKLKASTNDPHPSANLDAPGAVSQDKKASEHEQRLVAELLKKDQELDAVSKELEAKNKENQDLLGKLARIEKVFSSGIAFLHNNGHAAKPEAGAPSNHASVLTPEAAFRIKMEEDFAQKDNNHKLVMGEVEAILHRLADVAGVSKSLKDRVLDIKIRELRDNGDGKTKTIIYTLDEFKKELVEHERQLAAISRAIKYEIPFVRSILNNLNELEELSPREDIGLRDQFEENWNQVCRQSHTLKWEIQYLLDAISLLPALKDLDERLQVKEGEAQKAKYKYKDKSGLDEKEKADLKKDLELFQEQFTPMNEEHTKLQSQVLDLLNLLRPKELQEEYMRSFVHHNKAGEQINRDEVLQVLKDVNVLRNQLAKKIVIEWKKTCEHIKMLSIEIDQMGYGVEKGAIPYKSSIGASALRGGYAAGKYAKVSTEYDLKLEEYTK